LLLTRFCVAAGDLIGRRLGGGSGYGPRLVRLCLALILEFTTFVRQVSNAPENPENLLFSNHFSWKCLSEEMVETSPIVIVIVVCKSNSCARGVI